MAGPVKFTRVPYVVKKFNRLLDKTVVAYIAGGAYEHKLAEGAAQDIEDKQAEWKPLSPRYKKAKIRGGFSGEIWVRTGATRRALTGNVITKVGVNRGVVFDVTAKGRAYLYPKTIFRYAGGANHYQVLNRLGNGKKIGRPLLVWMERDMPHVERDVARRIAASAQGQGFEARATK